MKKKKISAQIKIKDCRQKYFVDNHENFNETVRFDKFRLQSVDIKNFNFNFYAIKF